MNAGLQSGTYLDETGARWVGIGGPGSSVPTADVLAEGFFDYCHDSDFADFDNDGDLDLFHSSYGGQFGGTVPSRIFLNDGTGRFQEFNPSGHQLAERDIQDGEPGLWCEGVQLSDTTSTDGTFSDIASSAVGIDIGDVDGDFDLDVLHGARNELPRLFRNRLEENGGVLSFRDVTGTLPVGYASGSGHYEQQIGDLDGDLDLFGVNWSSGMFSFDDVTLENDGSGGFQFDQTLPDSSSDDSAGEFLDYDLDGDLDLFVASFSGSDRLYRNDEDGSGDFDFSQESGLLPAVFGVARDAVVCDADSDGDSDVFVSNGNAGRNFYFENLVHDDGVGPQDAHAPYVPNLERAPDRSAGPAPTVVRAHVYDNAP